MNIELQHKTLMEWTGWTNFRITTRYNGISDYEALSGDYNGICCELPPLTLDLLHEAEKKFTAAQCFDYQKILHDLRTAAFNAGKLEDKCACLFDWNATAPQRLEALLRTVGLWREV